jgi:hypothetical protein
VDVPEESSEVSVASGVQAETSDAYTVLFEIAPTDSALRLPKLEELKRAPNDGRLEAMKIGLEQLFCRRNSSFGVDCVDFDDTEVMYAKKGFLRSKKKALVWESERAAGDVWAKRVDHLLHLV